MQFHSLTFMVFLALIFLLNYTVLKKQQNILLLFASFAFYAYADVRGLVFIFLSILTTYCGAKVIDTCIIKRSKVFWLILVVFLNVGLLLLFKTSPIKSLIVPMGISFYTLQAIGYLVDVSKGKRDHEENIITYALYVSFFPSVVSGPIQRSNSFLPQLKKERLFDYDRIVSGIYCFAWGFFEKVVIANRLSYMVDVAFVDVSGKRGSTLLFAIILYGLQLYCDFSGYSHLAIGAARVLGISFEPNFKQPYFATSVKDFWRRWHISLSEWFRDYIYIPLGGNRKGNIRKYRNLLITFLISGLWHGTGVQYIVWGGLHGLYQIMEDMLHPKHAKKKRLIGKFASIVITFALVDFAWIFFRSNNIEEAICFIKNVITNFDLRGSLYFGEYLLGRTKIQMFILFAELLVVFTVDLLRENNINIFRFSRKIPPFVRGSIYLFYASFMVIVLIRDFGSSPANFIYAGF